MADIISSDKSSRPRRSHIARSAAEAREVIRSLLARGAVSDPPTVRRGETRKPADLIYGVNERPSVADAIVVALQHVLAIAVNLVYPLLLARQAGLSNEAAADMLRGPIGSHYLAPMVYASSYLAPGLLAIEMGGMPLFWGMTIVAGLATLVLASVWDRLRTLIPPEAAGLVVFLVGATIAVAALRLLHQDNGSMGVTEASVMLITLMVMIALNIWSKGRLRLFSVLVGLLGGYAVAIATGLLETHSLRSLAGQPILSIPSIAHMQWSFDAKLIAPFVVIALANAMVTTGILTTYQRITDADWVRPDMRSITSGIRGDGLATAIAGLLCSFGVATGPANAGLVAATGVASRVVAYPIAAILVFAAVVPAFAGMLAIMPAPVMAAGLLFPAMFIMISGVQIISSRVLDARRTVVIGAGIITFLLIAIFPRTFAGAPEWLEPITGSPLLLAMITALGLNVVFRIGIKRSVEMSIDPRAPQLQDMETFVERNAASWGARRDVITRVKFALLQAVDVLAEFRDSRSRIQLTMIYDELDIEVRLAYHGERLSLPESPPPKDEIKDAGGQRLFAGFLIRRQADKADMTIEDGLCVLHLHFRQ
jgi:xanthine permease XanP